LRHGCVGAGAVVVTVFSAVQHSLTGALLSDLAEQHPVGCETGALHDSLGALQLLNGQPK
jgi:hypothetical protein